MSSKTKAVLFVLGLLAMVTLYSALLVKVTRRDRAMTQKGRLMAR